MLFRPSSHGSARLSFGLALIAAASLTAACGDVELSRGTIDGQTAPGQSSPGNNDPNNGRDTGYTPDDENPNRQPDENGHVMVPWSHEITGDTLDSAIFEDGKVTFPLEGNDFLIDVAIADILYSFDLDNAFIYRVEAIDNTPEEITFFVRDAAITELIVETNDQTRERARIARQNQGLTNFSQTGSRKQGLDDAPFEPFSTVIQFPEISAKGCRLDGGGWTASASLDWNGISGKVGAPAPPPENPDDNPDYGVRGCGDATVGLKMSTQPTITIEIADIEGDLQIDSSFFGHGNIYTEAQCDCFFDNFQNQGYVNACGFPVSQEASLKENCNGRLQRFEAFIDGRTAVELKELLIELYAALSFEKKFVDAPLVKVVFAIAAVPATFEINFVIKGSFETDGGLQMSWAGKNAPGISLGATFGITYVDGFQRVNRPSQLEELPPMDAPDFIGQVNAEARLDASLEFSLLLLGFAGVKLDLPTAYTSAKAAFSRNFTTGENTCELSFKIGASAAIGLKSDLGWLGDLLGINGEITWPLIDTCDAEEGSFLANLCLFYDFSEMADFICPGPMPARIDRVRLRVDDPTYPPGQNGPGSVPVDALFVQRVPISSAPYYIAPTRVIVDGAESAEALAMINEIQFRACDPELWEEKVILFDDEIIVDYADPFEAGDLIRVHRQGFNPGTAANNPNNPEDHGKLCVPNGSFHIDVGRSDQEQWETLITNVVNTSDHRITESFLELFAEEDGAGVGN